MTNIFQYVYLVGCGGTGSYILPPLLKVIDYHPKFKSTVVIAVDGDYYEKSNIDRQLFNPELIGVNKARALKFMYKSRKLYTSETYINKNFPFEDNSLLICAADSNTARLIVLETVDRFNASEAIIAGNETEQGHAYLYKAEYKDTQLDPRVRYPNLLEENKADRILSCAKQQNQPTTSGQTVYANFLSAACVLSLFYSHYVRDYSASKPLLPYEHSFNYCRFTTHLP